MRQGLVDEAKIRIDRRTTGKRPRNIRPEARESIDRIREQQAEKQVRVREDRHGKYDDERSYETQARGQRALTIVGFVT